jgi:hypothetical protein
MVGTEAQRASEAYDRPSDLNSSRTLIIWGMCEPPRWPDVSMLNVRADVLQFSRSKR